MEAQFWLDRWREGITGFHQERVTPLLAKYWPGLGVPSGGRVLVPLCGKTLDMAWLAQQGYSVLGVELSPLAVEQFFTGNGLTPSVRATAAGDLYSAGNIEILCGDIFALDAQALAGCAGVYDRAALIALPPEMRKRYAAHVYASLPTGARGLLITLDYEQDQMPGPPFSVGDAEVQALYEGHTQVRQLDRRAMLDKEPKFAERGLTWLDTLVYALEKR
ncbi:thiopurine S-methyltransferase [Achromobacter aloeverae]|uniref:Thiopurine S-methyltransferase n=1 Tax=Achromobacter aloeverae TaxID=1750518 RepID=A0A4V1MRC5_9BURK|nr:thiopurine S-methyltransferase [Achromobacter aloeverae]RXN83256.1 thiopurine S-methyltransferase [Achromobacter aloeverae]